MNWLRKFDQAIFRFGSPVSLGVFRAVAGSLAFINLVMVGIHFQDWFTEVGFVPSEFAVKQMGPISVGIGDWAIWFPRFNPLAMVTDARITGAVYIITVIAALLTALGLWTRLATILLFVGTVALHHRTSDILHSGDTLMRAWIFILMISPCAAAFSLDRWLKVKRGLVSGPPEDISIWPLRLVQYQLAIVYFTTVWHKMGGTFWRDGTATYYSGNLHEFDRFWMPGFTHQQPYVAITTYGTLAVELALATLVFAKPMRKWVLLAGLALHMGIEYSMNIPLFAFIICSGYLCFYEGEEVSAWWDRLKLRFGRKPAVEAAPDP